jgi:hypothetical protein
VVEIEEKILSQFELEIFEEIKEAFDFALASPLPNAEKAERGVYA